MDVQGDVHTLLEERYTDSVAGPVGPAGAGVGGRCSSDVPGVVDCLVCARRCTRLVTRAQPMHIPSSLVPDTARICLVS